MNKTLFTKLSQPIEAIIASMSKIIDQESNSQKLFFADFVNKVIFGDVYQVSSREKFIVGTENQTDMSGLGLNFTPFLTLKDGFSRFESKRFKQLFEACA